MEMYGYEFISANELTHHGILGQKWGKRNGPPYPLDVSDHSAREKKAGWRKSLNQSAETSKKKQKENAPMHSQEPQKDNHSKSLSSEYIKNLVHSKQFKTAMKVTLGLAATYATYKIGQKYIHDLAVSYMDSAFLHEQQFDYEFFDELAKNPKDYAREYFSSDDPDAYKKLVAGINHGADIYTDPLRNQNCTLCSAAIIARLKGLDATAAETLMHGYPTEIIEKYFYRGAKFVKPKLKNSEDFLQYLIKQGDKHYGSIHVYEKEGNGGHSIVYAIKNGKVEFLDGQLEGIWTIDKLSSRFNLAKSEVCDLTNCELKPFIAGCIMPAGKNNYWD